MAVAGKMPRGTASLGGVTSGVAFECKERTRALQHSRCGPIDRSKGRPTVIWKHQGIGNVPCEG